MTYLLETARGFEVDPSGTLSAGLVSAWPLTELAGPRSDLRGNLGLSSTTNMRFATPGGGSTSNAPVTTSALHPEDQWIFKCDGETTGSITGGTARKDLFLFSPLGYNYGDRSAFSFSVWAYITATMAATGHLAVIAGHVNYDWLDGWDLRQIEVSGNQKIQSTFSAAGSYANLQSTTNLAGSTWYHIVTTWDGTNRTLFVNGSSEASDTPTVFGEADTSAIFSLGRATHAFYPYTWQGYMCHAALWKKQLSAAEVTTLYNSGVPNRYKPWVAAGG